MDNRPGPAFNLSDSVSLRDALCALTAINHDIVLLDYGNIVIRRGYRNLTNVRLLGGGVGGKDLSQAIFVGKGMLTAAILGEDIVPSSREILHTIKELNEENNSGMFVIVQGNADLFNFGLAVERANADCRSRVKLLPIDDDKSDNKERYSCGFILLTKILGAMAEEGAMFNDIYKFYENIVDEIITVPLNYVNEESGSRRRKNLKLTVDFEKQVQRITDKRSEGNLSLHPSIPTVALINTSRALERLMELGLVKQVIDRLREIGVCLVRMYYSSFLTTAAGTASLTVIKVQDKKVIDYLDASCGASGWKHVNQFLHEITLKNEIPGLLKHQGKQSIQPKGPKLGETQSVTLVKSVYFACDALSSCERQLNIIDAEKSDGNVGSRLKAMAQHISKRLTEKKLPIHSPYAFLRKIGVIAESAIGGTMGSMYGIFFEAAGNVFGELPDDEYVTPFMWAKALSAATAALKQYCTHETAEYTMFHPIKCCEKAITKEIAREQHFLQCYGFGVSVAEEMAQKTRLPQARYPDGGAHAVGIWMRAIFEGVKLMSNPCEGDKM